MKTIKYILITLLLTACATVDSEGNPIPIEDQPTFGDVVLLLLAIVLGLLLLTGIIIAIWVFFNSLFFELNLSPGDQIYSIFVHIPEQAGEWVADKWKGRGQPPIKDEWYSKPTTRNRRHHERRKKTNPFQTIVWSISDIILTMQPKKTKLLRYRGT
jgi:hypothetical protein